jgi:formylglycine-generating enzyme required for sulfatase activity
MLGDVWQWTADWYGEKYYQGSERRDPTGPPGGTMRIVRGGSWADLPKLVRVSFRNWSLPGDRHVDFGFRCVGE